MKNLSKNVVLLFGLLSVMTIMPLASSYAQIPQLLSYQGVLCDSLGNPKPDALYNITFRFYDIESGGVALWTETKLLEVKRGLFSTTLGNSTNLYSIVKFDKPYWLGIQAESES